MAVIGGAAAASAACTATPRVFLGWAGAREGEAAGTSRLGHQTFSYQEKLYQDLDNVRLSLKNCVRLKRRV